LSSEGDASGIKELATRPTSSHYELARRPTGDEIGRFDDASGPQATLRSSVTDGVVVAPAMGRARRGILQVFDELWKSSAPARILTPVGGYEFDAERQRSSTYRILGAKDLEILEPPDLTPALEQMCRDGANVLDRALARKADHTIDERLFRDETDALFAGIARLLDAARWSHARWITERSPLGWLEPSPPKNRELVQSATWLLSGTLLSWVAVVPRRMKAIERDRAGVLRLLLAWEPPPSERLADRALADAVLQDLESGETLMPADRLDAIERVGTDRLHATFTIERIASERTPDLFALGWMSMFVMAAEEARRHRDRFVTPRLDQLLQRASAVSPDLDGLPPTRNLGVVEFVGRWANRLLDVASCSVDCAAGLRHLASYHPRWVAVHRSTRG
jgi:hypothetical protein